MKFSHYFPAQITTDGELMTATLYPYWNDEPNADMSVARANTTVNLCQWGSQRTCHQKYQKHHKHANEWWRDNHTLEKKTRSPLSSPQASASHQSSPWLFIMDSLSALMSVPWKNQHYHWIPLCPLNAGRHIAVRCKCWLNVNSW